jgi:hypothetical protein
MILSDQMATLAYTQFGFVVPGTPKPNGPFWRISKPVRPCFQSQLLPNPPVWLRRPWDTKAKWGVSQDSHLRGEKLPRTGFSLWFGCGSLGRFGVGSPGPVPWDRSGHMGRDLEFRCGSHWAVLQIASLPGWASSRRVGQDLLVTPRNDSV